MQRILRKRIFRDLRENIFRYLALGFMIILGMYIVISLVGAADSIIEGTKDAAEANRVEDGQFKVFVPLSEEENLSIAEAGVVLEEHFSLDYELSDDSTLRIFSKREKIDLVQVDSGNIPAKNGEILLEKRYCEEHDISVGDAVTMGGVRFKVCGIGTAPDYESVLRNLSDSAVDSVRFGIGFVTEEDYRLLKEKGESISSEEYSYAYLLKGKITQDELWEKLQNMETLQCITADENPRIASAAADKSVDHASGLAAGVIILILFAYIISVFTVHGIEREARMIGTLYAMGVKKNELLRHYLTLPALVTFIAASIGTALGYSSFGVGRQMIQPYGYFSIPRVGILYEPYLLIYGIAMPPAAAVLTNYLVIRKKLDRPVLALIRGEDKKTNLKNRKIRGSFVHVFRVRHILREKRTAFTVFCGMFISLLVVMLSLNCYALCVHIQEENAEDTWFEYMYTYKYPEEKVPEGSEEAYGVTMKKEALGYNFDVTLLGINKDNPYFDASVNKGGDRVLISSALSQKYNIDTGDILILYDEEKDRYYAFETDGIVKYSAGYLAFMDIESMRELMGKNEDYYNIVFSDSALDIDGGRLYSTLSKDEVKKSSSVFVSQMTPMIVTLLAASVLIFAVVMYLMMKVMIDRSAMSISMLKVFGYRKKEIGKLYLNGNLFIVVLSAAMGIPLSKAVMDRLYPYLVSNIACGLNLTFSRQMYAGVFVGILALYFIINRILMFRVSRILPAEVLKNRE